MILFKGTRESILWNQLSQQKIHCHRDWVSVNQTKNTIGLDIIVINRCRIQSCINAFRPRSATAVVALTHVVHTTRLAVDKLCTLLWSHLVRQSIFACSCIVWSHNGRWVHYQKASRGFFHSDTMLRSLASAISSGNNSEGTWQMVFSRDE